MATFFRSVVRAGPSRLAEISNRTIIPSRVSLFQGFSSSSLLFNDDPTPPPTRTFPPKPYGMESAKLLPLDEPINRDPLEPRYINTPTSKSPNSSQTVGDPDGWWAALSANLRRRPVLPGNQYSGRSFQVSGGDPMGRIRQLSMTLSRAGVKKYVRRSEFFERPSERKRRLGTERHRRRFQEMVREKVQTVQMIRNRD